MGAKIGQDQPDESAPASYRHKNSLCVNGFYSSELINTVGEVEEIHNNTDNDTAQ